MSIPTLQLHVDFEDDSDFTGSNEDVTNDVLPDRALTWERGGSLTAGLPQPQVGRLDATLNNTSRKYSPRNASSPLYGSLEPDRSVRLQTTTGGTIPLWRGETDEWTEETAIGGRVAHLAALGALAKLQAADKIGTILHTDITTDEAFEFLCDAAGLAATEYVALDTGKTTLAAWWCDGDNALTMLLKIRDAEGPGARIYEDAQGRIVFHSRHYRLTVKGTSAATIRDTATSPFYEDFDIAPRRKAVITGAGFDAKVLTLAGVYTVVFEYPEPTLAIGPGQSVRFSYRADAPFTLPIWNIDTTDARADESPEILSASTTATTSELTITNPNSRTITYQGVTLQVQAGTIGTYGVRDGAGMAGAVRAATSQQFDPWPYMAREAAQGLVDAVVSAYGTPRAAVTIVVRNADATNLTQQLNRDISDRITVVNAQAGLNGPVYIERIKQQVGEGRYLLTTEFGCEEPGTYGDWLVSGSGLSGTGRAGY